jgi:hypothetical protein
MKYMSWFSYSKDPFSLTMPFPLPQIKSLDLEPTGTSAKKKIIVKLSTFIHST